MKATKEQLISYQYMPLTYEEILSEVEHELEEEGYAFPDYKFGYDNCGELENFMNVMSDRLGMHVHFFLVGDPMDITGDIYLQGEFYLLCRKEPRETLPILFRQDRAFEMTGAHQIADKLSEVQKSYLEMIDKLQILIDNYNDGLAN